MGIGKPLEIRNGELFEDVRRFKLKFFKHGKASIKKPREPMLAYEVDRKV